MRYLVLTLIPAGSLFTAFAPRAAAQEYCVSCIEPPAVYRCVIGDVRPGDNTQPLQLLCISTLAKEGGHASCGVRRGTVFDCDAPIKRVSAAPAVKAVEQSAAPADGKDVPKQPQTAEQLARQVTRSSGEQVEKATNSMSSGARKAWNCMISFFQSC